MKNINWKYIFLTICLLLLEFIIIDKAYNLSENSNLVSLVSFAGTLASIILALVAIVYTFFEGVSQKSQSNTIQNQIEVLKQTVTDVDISKKQLSEDLERLDDINDKLDNALGHVIESKKMTSQLATNFDSLIGSQFDNQKDSQEELLNKKDALSFLDSMLNSDSRSFLLFIKYLSDKNLGLTHKDAFKLSTYISEIYHAEEEDEIKKKVVDITYGELTILAFSLHHLGLIYFDKDEIELRDSVKTFIDNLYDNLTEEDQSLLKRLQEA